jgi:NAD(P)-dependent dehydrogenase (short-subunit alcohol dehydrogenase family)
LFVDTLVWGEGIEKYRPESDNEALHMGMLDGKVAVVTNSGEGMGRTIALLMAEEGARVVVHDSEDVVREIKDRGGDAVGCSASVVSWEGSHELVETATGRFGRLDVLVNSPIEHTAAQGRKISEIGKEDWEAVMGAYLKSSFLCNRAALPCMRKQKYGRLIHFISAEAVIGGVGQALQGAAQMAVAGLSRNAAIEMERSGVTSNCIVPCSGSRTDADPADVAPLAVFLAGDGAQGLSGQIFGVRDREILLFSQPRIQRSIHDSRGWTVERISGMFETTMLPHFTPLESSDEYFSWDSTL